MSYLKSELFVWKGVPFYLLNNLQLKFIQIRLDALYSGKTILSPINVHALFVISQRDNFSNRIFEPILTAHQFLYISILISNV